MSLGAGWGKELGLNATLLHGISYVHRICASMAPRRCTPPSLARRYQLGLVEPPPASAEVADGEWLDLRPRWPLTDRKDPRRWGHAVLRIKDRIHSV